MFFIFLILGTDVNHALGYHWLANCCHGPVLSLPLAPELPLVEGGPKCAHSFAEKNAARTFRRMRPALTMREIHPAT